MDMDNVVSFISYTCSLYNVDIVHHELHATVRR